MHSANTDELLKGSLNNMAVEFKKEREKGNCCRILKTHYCGDVSASARSATRQQWVPDLRARGVSVRTSSGKARTTRKFHALDGVGTPKKKRSSSSIPVSRAMCADQERAHSEKPRKTQGGDDLLDERAKHDVTEHPEAVSSRWARAKSGGGSVRPLTTSVPPTKKTLQLPTESKRPQKGERYII